MPVGSWQWEVTATANGQYYLHMSVTTVVPCQLQLQDQPHHRAFKNSLFILILQPEQTSKINKQQSG